MEGLGHPSAFFGAGEIPATERNIITQSHGVYCIMSFYISSNPASSRVVPWLKGKGLPGKAALLQSHWPSGGWGDGASGAMPTSKYSIRSFSSKRRSRFVPNEHAENKNKMITKMITNNR